MKTLLLTLILLAQLIVNAQITDEKGNTHFYFIGSELYSTKTQSCILRTSPSNDSMFFFDSNGRCKGVLTNSTFYVAKSFTTYKKRGFLIDDIMYIRKRDIVKVGEIVDNKIRIIFNDFSYYEFKNMDKYLAITIIFYIDF